MGKKKENWKLSLRKNIEEKRQGIEEKRKRRTKKQCRANSIRNKVKGRILAWAESDIEESSNTYVIKTMVKAGF